MKHQTTEILRENHRLNHQIKRLKNLHSTVLYACKNPRVERMEILANDLKFRKDMNFSLLMDMSFA